MVTCRSFRSCQLKKDDLNVFSLHQFGYKWDRVNTIFLNSYFYSTVTSYILKVLPNYFRLLMLLCKDCKLLCQVKMLSCCSEPKMTLDAWDRSEYLCVLINLDWWLNLGRHPWPGGHACFYQTAAGARKFQPSFEQDNLRKNKSELTALLV